MLPLTYSEREWYNIAQQCETKKEKYTARQCLISSSSNIFFIRATFVAILSLILALTFFEIARRRFYSGIYAKYLGPRDKDITKNYF